MKSFPRLLSLLICLALLGACPLLGACAPKPVSRAADPTSPAPDQFSLVQRHPDQGKLKKLLAVEVEKAQQAGRTPYVQMTAKWCTYCQALSRNLSKPVMIDAFTGTYIILLDYDEWEFQLPASGLNVVGVPAFFELDDQGRATGRSIYGAVWDSDDPEVIAPYLKEFFNAGQ